ncbi:MAG TPA: porin family protein [Bacteroidia bacterium]
MRRQLYNIIFFFIAAGSLAAQTDTVVKDKPIRKILDPKDRIVVDFNYDGFTHYPSGIAPKAYSLGGNVYFMFDYPVGYGPLSLAFGAGFSTHDVHTNGKVVYSLDGKYTSFEPIYTKYNTNKLSLNYFEIPLELRVRTRGNHKFKTSLGFKAGYLYNVHTKYEDAEGKIKVYKIKNINPFRYGATFRIGYDRYNIQAFYALSELFLKGRGEPGMVPFSIGVGLLLY